LAFLLIYAILYVPIKRGCFGQRRGKSFFNNLRFVMEILSPSTEKYDHTGKKDLYCCQEIDEYWIVGWQKRQV